MTLIFYDKNMKSYLSLNPRYGISQRDIDEELWWEEQLSQEFVITWAKVFGVNVAIEPRLASLLTWK